MFRDRYLWPAFAVATVLFYFAPLFLFAASIHWDLADVAYPAQKYIEESFKAGKLPHWTPFLYSGTPFLANPEVGAWYPLHWPFFAIGITPRIMVWELALHSFLALSGTFLLARKLFGSPIAALAGAMFYAWSGYFAGRSSQLASFEIAALLPWLLWAGLGGSARCAALAGLVGGLIGLAGDLPSSVFALTGAVLFLLFSRQWKPAIVTVVGAVLVSAVVVVPGLGLMREAVPALTHGSSLTVRGLAAIFSADYWGVLTGLYKGPEDMRQFYLYSGLLSVPMMLAGLIRRAKLLLLGSLVVPPVVLAFLHIRSFDPMDAWFVAALGLALMAASGSVFVAEQTKKPYLWMLLLVLTTADLWHWNMYKNPLVYAHISFEELYGKPLERFEQNLRAIEQGRLTRLWSSTEVAGLGPLDAPLLTRTEVSYGSGLLKLSRYADYVEKVRGNPQLLNDLAITHGIDTQRGAIVQNPSPLDRVTAAPRVRFVASRDDAVEALKELDPAETAVVEALQRPISPMGARLRITNYEGDRYRVEAEAPAEFLLKLAVPYHSGWKASIDGAAVDVVPVNEALLGVFVPAGNHQVVFQFVSPGLVKAGVVSVLGLLLFVVLALFPSRFPFLTR